MKVIVAFRGSEGQVEYDSHMDIVPDWFPTVNCIMVIYNNNKQIVDAIKDAYKLKLKQKCIACKSVSNIIKVNIRKHAVLNLLGYVRERREFCVDSICNRCLPMDEPRVCLGDMCDGKGKPIPKLSRSKSAIF